MTMRLIGRATVLACVLAGLCASTAGASVARCNVPIRMSDGITLRANLFLPRDSGRFPLILTATGYNKDATNPTGQACSTSGGIASADPALLDKGYAVMLLDDRGTGASGGAWDSWGQRTQDDYGEVLDWIQAQPWSDTQVATTGASYMGITSFLIAEADAARVAAGKPRAVKTIWADVPMADAYRDVTFHGGAVDAGFIPLWLGLTTALSSVPPSTTPTEPQDAVPTWLGHLKNGLDFAGNKIVGAATGADDAYDGPFYELRSPARRAAEIRIPVAWTGGWWDIFQRGEPLLYEALTNAPVKKLFMSPHYHVSGGPAMEDPDIRLKWFDRWLKGSPTGVESKPNVNLYPATGGTKWQHFSAWPVPGTSYKRLHLADEKALADAKPAAGAGDEAPLLPVSSPCSRLTAQWTAGAAALGPCETDNRTFEATALTYTTPPLPRDTNVTGLLSANVWAELTAKDATLVAVLSDVDASGASNQVTAGFLLASQRALDTTRSTYDGTRMIRPWHPFTRDSQEPVTPGQPTAYRIEIYPTSAIFKKGHRLRLTISGANTPTTLTPLPALANELGGTIRLLHGGPYDSWIQIPVLGSSPGRGVLSGSR